VKTLDELISNPPEPVSKEQPPYWKRIWRVAYDAARGFVEDDCYAKASALTFFSLLSIVPVLAVLFGIAKGFGFEKTLESEITEQFSEQHEITEKLIEFAHSMLQNAQGGLIAGVGIILLLWSVIGLMTNIETALNDIWKTKNSRSFGRKVSDYLAIMVVAPIFLVILGSLNVFITTQITAVSGNILVDIASPFILFLLKLSPYFLSWVFFTFVYIFMPNTKVYFRSAVIAGIMAGTIFQIWQWIYITFQIGASSYGAVYGSFAALPLFLVWLQFSWMILLAGAELAVEIENDLFVPARILNPLSTKAAALLITYRCLEAFAQNKPAPTDRSLAQELGMSLNHVHILIESLQKARILSAVSYSDKTYGYQPARSIQSITMKKITDAIDKSNEIPASYKNSTEMQQIQDYLKEVDHALTNPALDHPLYQSENLSK
jgi:membrane protein